MADLGKLCSVRVSARRLAGCEGLGGEGRGARAAPVGARDWGRGGREVGRRRGGAGGGGGARWGPCSGRNPAGLGGRGTSGSQGGLI